jgi:hypothetical protein
MRVALTILKQGFVHYHSAQITFQNGRTLKTEFLEPPTCRTPVGGLS